MLLRRDHPAAISQRLLTALRSPYLEAVQCVFCCDQVSPNLCTEPFWWKSVRGQIGELEMGVMVVEMEMVGAVEMMRMKI